MAGAAVASVCVATLLLLASSGVPGAAAFKEHDFKKCNDAAFCKRLRGQKGDVYAVQTDSVVVQDSRLTASVKNENADGAEFQLNLTAYDGIVRLTIDEDASKGRFKVPSVLREDLPSREVPWGKQSKALLGGSTTLELSDAVSVTLTFRPVGVTVLVHRQPAVTFNGQQMFAMEHLREKKEGDPEGWWEETFKTHTDSKPRGPEAMSLDLEFPGAQHVYGLPERATSLSLEATTGVPDKEVEPYRMYNLDVFEYLAESNFGLYGSVPLLLAVKPGLTVGAFWLNAAEMFVDVSKPATGAATQWIAESGVVDLFFLIGPRPSDVSAQYATVTGGSAMPQLFALGYHQCRWNYRDEADTLAVDAGFDEHDIPYDVIWLDIEHTDGKRYLTWDSATFPHPEKLQDNIASRGRKMVTIVDPHIKRDAEYKIFKTAEDKGFYVKKRDSEDYDGWCWPGSSSYLDVLSPEVCAWWATNFHPGGYPGATKNLYIWNDMNEPSVFNGPEITFPKDLVHKGGVEHRDVHNLYGKLYHQASSRGLEERGTLENGENGDRPFVLSRAFFAGTQTVGPIWTGDNTADWDHLRVSIPMVVTINLAGIAFSGADVGGFFGSPSTELLTRWYQLGTYYPFFRGHAHLETARREPWLFGDPTTSRIRDAIRSRYAMLPYIYTLFRDANLTGQPVMRPMWFEFPEVEALYGEQDQFMLGPALLAAPVLQEGAASRTVLLPQQATWFDASTGAPVATDGTPQEVAVTMDSSPAYLRGGHIMARRQRARRSTAAMAADPITLVVALNSSGSAEGDLYMDDGSSFAFSRGAYVHRQFRYADGVLTSSAYRTAENVAAPTAYSPDVVIERIAILGLPGGVSGWQVSVVDGSTQLDAAPGPLHLKPGAADAALVVRKPNLFIAADWSLEVVQPSATA